VDVDRLLELDDEEPGARLDALLDGDQRQAESVQIVLLSLIAIEDALHECLGVQSLYIVEDAHLYAIFASVHAARISRDDVRRALLLLKSADLIFRFTCARKFEIADTHLKQIRANTWGKWYAAIRCLDRRHPDVQPLVAETTMATLRKQHAEYIRLAEALRSEITPSVASTASELNRGVPLKLLA
jgi:hypothetical protein